MSPRVEGFYVRPENVDSLESWFREHQEELPKIKPDRRDMPVIREDFTQEELVSTIRTCVESLPQDERLRNLIHWNAPQSRKRIDGIDTPLQWTQLMDGLKSGERARVTRAINALYHGLGSREEGMTLANVRKLNWRETLNFRHIGKKSVALLQRIFQPN